METPLPICFLSIFIVTGASLECETCAGVGNTCNGPMETCSPGFDMCAVTLSEARLGMKMNSVVKHCVQSKSCNDGTSIINLGKTGGLLSQVFCCVGAECKTMTPTLTPTRSKPNGNFCPACYAMNSECEEEWVQCNGEEKYCLDVSGTTDLGTLAVKTTMKGCTNSPTCEELKEHSSSISGITVTSSSSCRPAGTTSGGHRIVPGSFGLFLAALAGLQFVMHLP